MASLLERSILEQRVLAGRDKILEPLTTLLDMQASSEVHTISLHLIITITPLNALIFGWLIVTLK